MLKNRKKQIFVTLLAVLSLFVSAVSACACSHHEPVKAEVETSCHGTSNETTETSVQAEAKSRVLDANCSCFVKTSVPAIIAKTDDKRTTVEKPIADGRIAVLGELTVFLIRVGNSSVSELNPRLYKQDLLSSLPSRAPPRL
jgi:hypothetical protein